MTVLRFFQDKMYSSVLNHFEFINKVLLHGKDPKQNSNILWIVGLFFVCIFFKISGRTFQVSFQEAEKAICLNMQHIVNMKVHDSLFCRYTPRQQYLSTFIKGVAIPYFALLTLQWVVICKLLDLDMQGVVTLTEPLVTRIKI